MDKCSASAHTRAANILKQGGYKSGGSVKEMADEEVHKHEKNMHKGKKETMLKHGGTVHGHKGKARLDKKPRKASGGAVDVAKIDKANAAEMNKYSKVGSIHMKTGAGGGLGRLAKAMAEKMTGKKAK